MCSKFMKLSLPLTVILPGCFTFFMIPAVGHCTQLTAPYPMGAVMFTLDLKVVLALRNPSLIGYILSIRPIFIDTATVFEPWAFYYTHPMFKRYKRKTTVSSSPIAMVVSSSGHSR
ncbi:Protein CBG20426 [Caenorhabditis briggsae]|uniref:Protein CBG20426 n=1 Tax=Caenorhabditis briggsae TaxID=6238 RepID=A8XXS0_CAEBR|nr:Protein CBG20426 [Caenorhabditis briggsae]CAP37439.1 Protein CBG20426 [Caenorhabditis briggsae]